MRYTSAMVLSTLAVGQAAAGSVRHASFHARRNAEQKRDYDLANVDWNKVSYDLSGVNWSSVFNSEKPAATQAPAAPAPAASSAVVQAAAAKVTSAAAAYSAPAAKTSAAPAAASSSSGKSTDVGDQIESAVGDLLNGVSSWIKSMGISAVGANSKTNNGKMWLGSDSQWKTTFTNDASDDVMLLCWAANGFTGMTLNVNAPLISVNIPSGKSVDVSHAANVPGACGPAFKGTKLANFGGLDNTWYEFTFNNVGAFDITRNVNMNGNSISAKGSKCTSDMNTCVFKCTTGQSSCEKGYDLFNCGSSNGGGGGYDAVMQGTGGGCSMGASGEHVKVTFS